MNKPQQHLPIFLLVEWCVEEKNTDVGTKSALERVFLSPLSNDLALLFVLRALITLYNTSFFPNFFEIARLRSS
jgi:hypothetical protein